VLLFVPIVSHTEVLLLYERFQMLGPDEDGFVNRSVFQKPPYSTNPFSRQVIVLSWFILVVSFFPTFCATSFTRLYCGTKIGETLVYGIWRYIVDVSGCCAQSGDEQQIYILTLSQSRKVTY